LGEKGGIFTEAFQRRARCIALKVKMPFLKLDVRCRRWSSAENSKRHADSGPESSETTDAPAGKSVPEYYAWSPSLSLARNCQNKHAECEWVV